MLLVSKKKSELMLMRRARA